MFFLGGIAADMSRSKPEGPSVSSTLRGIVCSVLLAILLVSFGTLIGARGIITSAFDSSGSSP